jgi:hypothetical protein
MPHRGRGRETCAQCSIFFSCRTGGWREDPAEEEKNRGWREDPADEEKNRGWREDPAEVEKGRLLAQ